MREHKWTPNFRREEILLIVNSQKHHHNLMRAFALGYSVRNKTSTTERRGEGRQLHSNHNL